MDQGGVEEKEEPNRVKGEEGQGTCIGLKVRGVGRKITNQGGAGGMREPSGADWSTCLVVMGTEVLEGADGSTILG